MNSRVLASVSLLCAAALASGCDKTAARPKSEPATQTPLAPGIAAFRVPEIDEIADSAMRASIERGQAILEATRDSLPHNVGGSLRCTSCHLSAGTARNALTWVGVYSRYPQYRARSGHVETLEDRINDCFERSMNGESLRASSSEMRDIVAYLAFLSRGVPAGASVDGQGLPKLEKMSGDTARGAQTFTETCARCHGANGQGSAVAPALWGPRSFNDGAGMSRVSVFAAFIHQLMPLDRPRSLTVQQAYDLAVYVNSRPRPTFPGREHDWLHDPVPADLGYPLRSREPHPSR